MHILDLCGNNNSYNYSVYLCSFEFLGIKKMLSNSEHVIFSLLFDRKFYVYFDEITKLILINRTSFFFGQSPLQLYLIFKSFVNEINKIVNLNKKNIYM